MDLNTFMKGYADEIGGSFSEYDSDKSIIIVPLPDERFQTVLGHKKHISRYEKLVIEFSSKVCPYNADIDTKRLLEENTNFCHAKFVLVEDFIKVEASLFVESATQEVLKEVIQEVANLADNFELELTGEDVH